MLLTVRPDNVPPVVVTSEALRPVGTSLNVKVMVAVCPASKESVLLVMATVGATVSTK